MMRYVAFYFGSADGARLDNLKSHPGVEIYYVDGPDVTDQIDLGLLNDLHCPLTLAFVGGEQAKDEAKAYGGVWIEDSPALEDDLLRFFGIEESA